MCRIKYNHVANLHCVRTCSIFFNSRLSKMLATSIFTGGKQIIKQWIVKNISHPIWPALSRPLLALSEFMSHFMFSVTHIIYRVVEIKTSNIWSESCVYILLSQNYEVSIILKSNNLDLELWLKLDESLWSMQQILALVQLVFLLCNF